MRKVTVISEHDHWADYAEYIAPQHPQPNFKPRQSNEPYTAYDWSYVIWGGATAIMALIGVVWMICEGFQ